MKKRLDVPRLREEARRFGRLESAYQTCKQSYGVDGRLLKPTSSIRQPQSSCPYKTPDRKSLAWVFASPFVYEKTDDPATKTGCLNILPRSSSTQ
jgi:hypothetical protein